MAVERLDVETLPSVGAPGPPRLSGLTGITGLTGLTGLMDFTGLTSFESLIRTNSPNRPFAAPRSSGFATRASVAVPLTDAAAAKVAPIPGRDGCHQSGAPRRPP